MADTHKRRHHPVAKKGKRKIEEELHPAVLLIEDRQVAHPMGLQLVPQLSNNVICDGPTRHTLVMHYQTDQTAEKRTSLPG